MNRRDFYFRQNVTEGELDGAFDAVEAAIWNVAVDHELVGVTRGLTVVQNGTPNLTVNVTGPGCAYDGLGRRIEVPSTQNVNVAVDENSVSTTVAGGGNEKWVSVFLEFDRFLSDPRIDGNSLGLFFQHAESYRFVVRQGAEASTGTATRPPLDSDLILLADIRRTFGVTTILNAEISVTRRQDVFRFTSGALNLTAGTTPDAVQALLALVASNIGGTGAALARTAWLGGRTNPATTVDAALDKIIVDLGATAAGDDGAERIGAEASGNLTAGSVRSQLNELDAEKLALAGGTMTGTLSLGAQTLAYTPARLRTFIIPMSGWTRYDYAVAENKFQYRGGLPSIQSTQIRIDADSGRIQRGLNEFLKHGELITNVRMIATPGASRAGGNRMSITLHYKQPDFATPLGDVDPVSVAAVSDDGTTAIQTLDMSSALSGGHTAVTTGNSNTAREYFLTIKGGDDADTNNDIVWAVAVSVAISDVVTH